ncbi:MAG TPA: nitroreductase/quinone reductase family protein [Candidatus Limnocylindrales bacterium]|nr:nitroreductase/quinone reductase family protein [Candidatus Limnocylindrales bacterium]
MRRVVFALGALAGLVLAGIAWWRRHPRAGSGWVNRVVDPWLVRQGIVERSGGELGLIEHVGRRSGVVRFSPVHPERSPNGFRIIVPLGSASQWARNVLAAGRCRLQVGETVYELDEPRLVSPTSVDAIPPAVAHPMRWLGFRYLELHRLADAPGTLMAAVETEAAEAAEEELVRA